MKKASAGSDHYVHKLIIDLIKENRHRFIKSVRPFLFGDVMGYPQLYHWMLSFHTDAQLKYLLNYQNLIVNLIVLLLHGAFSIYLASTFMSNVNVWNLLLYSSILFLSSGLLFDGQNARNAGLSARNLGFLLGQVFTYCCFFFFEGHSYFLLSFPIIMLLSLLSSQFTTQFIFFMMFILSFIFQDITFLLSNALGIALFILIFPATARAYGIFQWKHKKYYATYGTQMVLLPQRESIWGDFIHVGNIIRNKKASDALLYVYHNPVLKVITGVPALLLISAALILNRNLDVIHYPSLTTHLIVILASLLVFFITSFKYTRFLGEPERYVEFVISMSSALAAMLFLNNPFYILLCTLLGSCRVVVECYLLPYLKNRATQQNIKPSLEKEIDELRNMLNKYDTTDRPLTILSNNLEITKKLLNTKWDFFYGWLFFLSDEYNPSTIFKKHAVLSERSLPLFLTKYEITHLILDKHNYNIKDSALFCDLKKTWSTDHLDLYQRFQR
jgi:hypothetical protein